MTTRQTRFEKLRKRRRIAAVHVDITIFADYIREGVQETVVSTGLPKDALFVNVEKDILSQTFYFLYLHESFDSVPEGVPAPLLPVIFTRYGNDYRSPAK